MSSRPPIKKRAGGQPPKTPPPCRQSRLRILWLHFGRCCRTQLAHPLPQQNQNDEQSSHCKAYMKIESQGVAVRHSHSSQINSRNRSGEGQENQRHADSVLEILPALGNKESQQGRCNDPKQRMNKAVDNVKKVRRGKGSQIGTIQRQDKPND